MYVCMYGEYYFPSALEQFPSALQKEDMTINVQYISFMYRVNLIFFTRDAFKVLFYHV